MLSLLRFGIAIAALGVLEILINVLVIEPPRELRNDFGVVVII